MDTFILFAQPWWVNILVVLPPVFFFLWRRSLKLSAKRLLVAGIFGAAFGYVEASVVVYLRGAAGLLSECRTRLPDGMISFDRYRQSELLSELPRYFLTIEMSREGATIVMIVAVALLAAWGWRERVAMFFWVFALWDIFYYLGLKITIGWPENLTTPDVLFLLPVPWLAQVWFPLLVSGLFIFVVFVSRRKT